MRLLSTLGAVAALSSLSIVASREVFAHYMVGNVLKEHAEQDIDLAKAAGITGFSLNIGTPQPFVDQTLGFLFDHAESVTGFHLHISMDIWASGDINLDKGHPDLYNDLLHRFVGRAAYFKVNGKPYVTTFSDGGLTREQWNAWKLDALGTNLYFCPDFDGTPGYTTGADAWWSYWGDTVDCVFSWDSAWRARPGIDPSTGSLGAGTIEIDLAVIGKAHSKGKGYNMGISTLQYKNAYSTNVYRDGNMMIRMLNMLSMSSRPDYATVLTWACSFNDGPESHYIGPIWSEQNTDADPARYVTSSDMWSHAAWRPLIAAFADAFIRGGGIGSMTPHGSTENVVGAIWYKTVMGDTTCPNGDHPGGWEVARDDLSWGLVLKAGKDTSNYRLYLISGGTITLHTGFKDGLNFGTTVLSPGMQRLELYDGPRLIYEAKGGRDVHSDCPDGIYNMNSVAVSVLPPKLTGATGSCTFHFTQFQKPNPASDPYTFTLTVSFFSESKFTQALTFFSSFLAFGRIWPHDWRSYKGGRKTQRPNSYRFHASLVPCSLRRERG
ncbi:glycosyl hydrolase family 71-domain-containing protein [Mycena crocata]|nr:glycosyl hydrolase family 71-domain-containing protein [Mycena crocata]